MQFRRSCGFQFPTALMYNWISYCLWLPSLKFRLLENAQNNHPAVKVCTDFTLCLLDSSLVFVLNYFAVACSCVVFQPLDIGMPIWAQERDLSHHCPLWATEACLASIPLLLEADQWPYLVLLMVSCSFSSAIISIYFLCTFN